MRIPRFFTPEDGICEGRITLRGTDATHAHTVLRLSQGDLVDVHDGRGQRYRVCLDRVQRKEVVGHIINAEPVDNESPLHMTLGLPLLKGGGSETALRKAVELGVKNIVPIKTERGVIKADPAHAEHKWLRWEKIVVESAKQCGRTQPPDVQPMRSIEEFCRFAGPADLKLVFWENEEDRRMRDLVILRPPESVALFTGPEGGLTEREVDTAIEHGFTPVTLGPRVLRAETAPLAGIAILQSLWGDL